MPVETYPIPAHSATIWIAGDQLMLALPSTPEVQGHIVQFPANQRGMEAVVALMTGRSRSHFNMLGARTAPPKATVERLLTDDKKYNEWLAAMGVKRSVDRAEAAEAEAFLAELDL